MRYRVMCLSCLLLGRGRLRALGRCKSHASAWRFPCQDQIVLLTPVHRHGVGPDAQRRSRRSGSVPDHALVDIISGDVTPEALSAAATRGLTSGAQCHIEIMKSCISAASFPLVAK